MGVERKNKHSFPRGKLYLLAPLLLTFPVFESVASELIKQYISTEYKLAFDYPADWIEKPPRGNDQVIVKVSSNLANKATCYMEVKPIDVAYSAYELADDSVKAILDRFPDTALLQKTTMDTPKPGVLLHVRIQYENFDQVESIENIRLYLLRDQQQVGLICGAMTQAMQANDGRLRKQLFEIVESLRLLND